MGGHDALDFASLVLGHLQPGLSTEKATPRDFQHPAGSCHSIRKSASKFDRDQTIINAVTGAFDRRVLALAARTIIELNARNAYFNTRVGLPSPVCQMTPPLRIAQIAPLHERVPPKLYGGTERVVSFLTEELVRQGHDVTLFAAQGRAGELRALIGIDDRGLTVMSQGVFERRDAEAHLHRDRQPPCQKPAAEPVEHDRQIDEAASHRNVGVSRMIRRSTARACNSA